MFSGLFFTEVTTEAERAYQLKDCGNTNVYLVDRDPSVNSNLRATPPENLPCANVEVPKRRTCQNPGKLACSACKLVSYCSEVRY